jgi:hypothetical protein
VANLAGIAIGAMKHTSVKNHAAANTSAEGEHQDVLIVATGAEPGLTMHSRIGIIVNTAGNI